MIVISKNRFTCDEVIVGYESPTELLLIMNRQLLRILWLRKETMPPQW